MFRLTFGQNAGNTKGIGTGKTQWPLQGCRKFRAAMNVKMHAIGVGRLKNACTWRQRAIGFAFVVAAKMVTPDFCLPFLLCGTNEESNT
ncbi:MAG: hypothetical protein N3D11_11040 [Candidatus Sumerlaeia bacterium]|nr:hypothetical protein [Candidatus Sumerlaeia bacterium]